MRTIRLMISDEQFDAFADAINELSRKTKRFETFRSTVQHACTRARATTFDEDDFHEFCGMAKDIEGPIGIWLQVSPEWKDLYLEVRERLTQISEIPVTDRLLVAYVIQHAVAKRLL